jgi:hypothetical protein
MKIILQLRALLVLIRSYLRARVYLAYEKPVHDPVAGVTYWEEHHLL